MLHGIAISYKKLWNHHVSGLGCWCRPHNGKMFLMHRNYEWEDDGSRFGAWYKIREPQTPEEVGPYVRTRV